MKLAQFKILFPRIDAFLEAEPIAAYKLLTRYGVEERVEMFTAARKRVELRETYDTLHSAEYAQLPGDLVRY